MKNVKRTIVSVLFLAAVFTFTVDFSVMPLDLPYDF